MKKTVIINRAVPGSGKTTITKCIIKELEKYKIKVALHSTDEYFMNEGRYEFDTRKLELYHKQNLDDFEASLEKGCDVAICDNTNLAPWQSEPYTNLARKHGYQIIFITLDPRELEKHVEAQKITDEKPDAHGVDESVLKDMIAEYELYDALLDKNTSIDPEKHLGYKWNKFVCKKQPTGELAKHFDSDAVIRILPSEYRHIQDSIGEKVLGYIKRKALITILGKIGMKDKDGNDAIATYMTQDGQKNHYYNTFALLIEKYGKEYEIIPFFTEPAKKTNKEILEFHTQNDEKFAGLDVEAIFNDEYFIKDEKDFEAVFAKINKAVSDERYDKIIVDVSHGFRHLPILATIDLVIENFKNTDKIEKILFAKETPEPKKYEIIDLKDYLDIANIAFILTAFRDNYTVLSHVNSRKYPQLIHALRAFSNDIMSLNLGHLFSSSADTLLKELEKISNPEIKLQAQNLHAHIQRILDLKNVFLPHELYYHFCRDLFKKDYIFLSVAFLFESFRLYIIDIFKNSNKALYNDIREITLREGKENEYGVSDSFIRIFKNHKKETLKKEQLKSYLKIDFQKKALQIAKEQYNIPNVLDENKKKLYRNLEKLRNSLAHIESGSFENIKNKTKELMERYLELIKPKIINV